jgi:hypothetical protein
LWTALALSAAARNAAVSKSLGVLTCVDLRSFMNPKDVNINVCNNFVAVTVAPKGITGKSRVRDIGQTMRKDFANKRDNGGLFILEDSEYEHKQGTSIMVLSNMGPLYIKPPVVDIWMQQTMESQHGDGALLLLSWTKISDTKNEFFGRLRYSPNIFTDAEASAMRASIRYVLEKLDPNLTVDAAVKELMKVQRSVIH